MEKRALTLTSYPQWLDKEAWEGFQDMRKAVKKPLTLRAAKMILAKLQRFKDAGLDPNEALDQSTNHCWADVYEPKQEQKSATTGWQETQEYLREQAARKPTPMPESVMAKFGLKRIV